MIFEIYFSIAGGINLGLERSWRVVESLIRRYPQATWKKFVNRKKGIGRYVVEIF